MNMKEIIDLTGNIDGFLSAKEGELLYKLAKNCKGNGVIVEIGSFKGKSTIWLAQGSKAAKNIKVYAIDPHTGAGEYSSLYGATSTFEEFRKHIENAKVNDIVVPLRKMSEEAAREFKEPVELVFIDGAHEYELVKLDFDLWSPKLVDHGIIAFHDTVLWPGPKAVVKEYIFKSKNFKNCGSVDSITFGKKVELNSKKDRLRNRYILILKDIYELAYRLHLPKPVKTIGKKILRAVQ